MNSWKALSKAKEILTAGGIIGLPTETVYGLAGSIDSEEAIQRIFAIKDRPFFDPLIVHIASIKQIEAITLEWTSTQNSLAERFWPGPLTIIARKSPNLNPMITAGLDTVAIRMPSHPLARRLLRSLKHPLAAPSANKFGRTSPTRYEHVLSEFSGSDLFVLEGGEAAVGIESTVIRVTEDAHRIDLEILRPGMITKSDFILALKDFAKKPFDVSLRASTSSPGHTQTHYQPSIPLVIATRNLSTQNVAYIEKDLNVPERSRYSELNLNPDPRLAARDLYHQMRKISESGAAWFFVRRTSDRQGELWDSLWNRIEKAASMVIS